MEESKENFKKIKSANQMMLDYFNKSFLSQLEDIQNLKTQIFEIDIKIDELDKTKDITPSRPTPEKASFLLSQMMAWIPSVTRSFRSRSKTCNP